MEALVLYLAKASGLLALFYLAYHFLVRKDTFFNSNRWFLLSGLITSLLLPLFFIKKIIWVTKPKISIEELVAYAQQTPAKIKELLPVEAFDWMQLIWVSYCLVTFVLVAKIVLNLLSLYRMLHKQQTFKREGYTLVDLERNIAPFSFFNYIVYNSDFYSDTELRSIILHEQIHSKEYHSIDVIVVQLFTAIFWFNPFVWLYKKAITQNLEYIADQKAIEQMEDRHAYQHALLKVVSNHNCLSITNHFYQSLIKKRIVMLNTSQSHKKNLVKYAFIIPALIGFVLLFQIKTIAQEKEQSYTPKSVETHQGADITFDSKETDKSLKTLKNVFKEEKIVTEVSKIKRNSAGEITGICIKMKCEDGRKKELRINQSTPIDNIFIYTNRMENGVYDFGVKHGTVHEISAIRNKVDRKRHGIYKATNDEAVYAMNADDSLDVTGNFDFDFDMEAPEAPESPEAPEISEVPDASEGVEMNDKISKVIVRKNGDKPLVIINGKVITDDKTIQETMKNLYIDDNSSSSDGDKKQIYINWEDAVKIRNKAMANAKIQMKRMKPIIKKQIRMANGDWKKVKEEMERAQLEIEASKPEMEKAKAEMIQAKEEMIQAKAEMLKAKAELDNERAKLKKVKSK
ncbi:M56 family metallopeptidase [Flavobacterium sp. N1994]|uniref:M56 family metallopeptidase n=1 Tax=Flavobacterium sp. N1994 TaxID=2986827 RepID=UPI002221C038|nr:M56 family metallopeptidase [Flavobacterium sp. N1994]